MGKNQEDAMYFLLKRLENDIRDIKTDMREIKRENSVQTKDIAVLKEHIKETKELSFKVSKNTAWRHWFTGIGIGVGLVMSYFAKKIAHAMGL